MHTIKGAYFVMKCTNRFERKEIGKCKNIILMEDKAPPHTVNFTKTILATIDPETMSHNSYSHELAPTYVRSFRPIRAHVGG
jgi:hypothetical protein